MRPEAPIFTQRTECRDCYRCIRECPVKAIQVQGGEAFILPDRCVLCGHCVDACPSGAKKVRDDVPRVEALLARGGRTVASLAPSFVTEFPELAPAQVIAGLRALGFAAVGETAVGAEQVSRRVGERMAENRGEYLLSSACPTAVAWLCKYDPERAAFLTELLSPLLCHARLLRESGAEAVVFIGPCIAKKIEADHHPELVDASLDFGDLRAWWQRRGIEPRSFTPGPEDRFTMRQAHVGALYPMEGGMIQGIRAQKPGLSGTFIALSGLERFPTALRELKDRPPSGSVFVELLACPGGCVCGPKSRHREASIAKELALRAYAPPAGPVPEWVEASESYSPEPLTRRLVTEERLAEALRQVGKKSAADEKNCGGCGYETCRHFALALIDGKAERVMCVAHLRELAQKKADRLIQKMPSAVALVDEQLSIIECNPRFIELFAPGEEPDTVCGKPIADLLPLAPLLENVLSGEVETFEKDVRHGGRILHMLLFQIERGRLLGALFEDVTRPAAAREQLLRRTRQVIEKNLKTVQEIAYLMGENAAESELILDGIARSFQGNPSASESLAEAPHALEPRH